MAGGRGNSPSIPVSGCTRLIIAGAGRLGARLRVPELGHPIPWAPSRDDLFPLPPVGHVLVLSEANSDAKDAKIQWSESGLKGCVHPIGRRRWARVWAVQTGGNVGREE